MFQLKKLINYILPKQGAGESSIHKYLTETEMEELSPFLKVMDFDKTHVLDGVFCCSDYKNEKIKSLIHRLKFFGEWNIAQDFALLLNNNLDGDSFDIITNVPADLKRLKQRGFHLPQILAKKLSKLSGIQYVDLLHKKSHTEAQTNKTRTERLESLKNIFELNPKIIEDEFDMSEVKTICIIDDVSTTGATLFECAKYLKSLSQDLIIYGFVIASEED